MLEDYLDGLQRRLQDRAGDLGALPRKEAAAILNYSTRYLSKLDCLGQGPEKIRRGNRVFYPVPSLIEWLKARSK